VTRLSISGSEREKFLNDPLVKRWTTRLEKGSAKTATMWASGLGVFCHLTGTSPKSLAAMKKQALMDLADRYESLERARGTRASTIASRLGFVRNFVQFSGDVQLPTGTFKVKGGGDSKEEPALTKEQIHTILASANLRERTVVLLMAQSGLRPGVIGNFDGTDGLRVGDIPDLKVGAKAEFGIGPAVIRVRKELSKAAHAYLSLIGEQGKDVLREYLDSRIRDGEKVTAESPLVRTDGGRFPRSSEVGDYVRNAFHRAKVEARPYSLRTTFISRLSAAEADGLVTHEFRLFWSGHRGDTSSTYSVNRGRLDEAMLLRMRGAYRKCEPLLETTPSASKADREVEVRREFLLSVGYSAEEAERAAGDRQTTAKLIREKLGADLPPQAQRIVSVEQATPLLAEGWKVVTAVGTSLVLNPPN
jgi:integrase